jgi:SAM-dependent methyltransferase
MANPLADPAAWDRVSRPYADHISPVFRGYAGRALDLAQPAPGGRLVDVAAGAGALSILAAERGFRVTAIDFSPAMIAALSARAPSIDVRVGDGMDLPFEDGTFDAAFSMFGLMFFSDRRRGFTELLRVLRPGGRAVVSSWPPMDRVPMFLTVFGTLFEIIPPPGPPPAPVLADPDSCVREMTDAGFRDVAVHSATFAFEAPSFDALWSWFPDSQVFLGILAHQLGPAWPEVAATLRERVLAKVGPGPQRIEMPALLTVGTRI